MSMSPTVSVVIPTYNRLNRLRRVVAALEAQTVPHECFEVVVVSDGSTDGTDQYLADQYLADSRQHHQLHLVAASQSNQGPAAARNRGVELARGRIILFVDDDVVAAPALIEEHLRSHQSASGDAVVIGPMLNPPDHAMRPWVAWEQSMLYKQYDAMNAGLFPATFRQFYTGNASLPRARFVDAGGFDTRFRRAEDVELAFRLDRAGLAFVWNPQAIGHHYADRPFESWLRTAHDYGVSEIVFGRDEGQDPTFQRIRAEFRRRHPLMQWTARLFVARPALETLVGRPLRALAVGADAVHADAISRMALSGLFNIAFYQGMASALGGRVQFRQIIVATDDVARRATGAPAA